MTQSRSQGPHTTYVTKGKAWVRDLYNAGVLHSTVVHTLILLLLYAVTVRTESANAVRIALSFAAHADTDALSLEKAPVLELKDSIEVSTDSPFSERIAHDVAKTLAVPPSLVVELDAFAAADEHRMLDIPGHELLRPVGGKPLSPADFEAETTVAVSQATARLPSALRSPASGLERFGDADTGAELNKRLTEAGAKTGDVQISIMWNSVDDIDLHVVYTPGNGIVDNINWTNRVGRRSSGMLDIDRNASSSLLTATPIENVFFPKGIQPKGVFTVYVHFYRSWTGAPRVPVAVRIVTGTSVLEFMCEAVLHQGPKEVRRFSYPP